jgi:hypothetical protein
VEEGREGVAERVRTAARRSACYWRVMTILQVVWGGGQRGAHVHASWCWCVLQGEVKQPGVARPAAKLALPGG